MNNVWARSIATARRCLTRQGEVRGLLQHLWRRYRNRQIQTIRDQLLWALSLTGDTPAHVCEDDDGNTHVAWSNGQWRVDAEIYPDGLVHVSVWDREADQFEHTIFRIVPPTLEDLK